jgi:hypothetical protein
MQKLAKTTDKKAKRKRRPNPLLDVSKNDALGLRVIPVRGKLGKIVGPLKEELQRAGMNIVDVENPEQNQEVQGMPTISRFEFSGRIDCLDTFGIVDAHRFSDSGKDEIDSVQIYCNLANIVIDFMILRLQQAARSIGGEIKIPNSLQPHP